MEVFIPTSFFILLSKQFVFNRKHSIALLWRVDENGDVIDADQNEKDISLVLNSLVVLNLLDDFSHPRLWH